MPRSYSADLRERVIRAVLSGRSCRSTAALFGLSPSTVIRWAERHRETGSAAPRPMGGRRRLVLLPERDWLLARISAAPDLTVRGLRAELIARGVRVSYGAVWAFLAAEGLTFKKNPVRRRAGSARRRRQARALGAFPVAG